MLQSSSKDVTENDHGILERSTKTLLKEIDNVRITASLKQEQNRKITLGQFFTPATVAELMAGMFNKIDLPEISLLDPGAGYGSLLAAFVARICSQPKSGVENLKIVAYEIDPFLIDYLHKTLELCTRECRINNISLNYEIRQLDFIEDAVRLHQSNSLENYKFTHAILNPPYLKINARSQYRSLLRSLGLETSNLYTGFMGVTAQLLETGGEFLAISPRSFCNGPYFRNFRSMFLDMMALRQIHLFESRQKVFKDNQVLQETVIIHAVKQKQKFNQVTISKSSTADDGFSITHSLAYREVIHPHDTDQFIHIIPDIFGQQVVEKISSFPCTLKDLGLTVSTGRVVDFRAKDYLRFTLEENTVPLIYPVNFSRGYIEYPQKTKKHQALLQGKQTASLLIPNEHYVLIKRFSSKEEKRRLVAVVHNAEKIDSVWIGLENHLNYIHQNGCGLNLTLAHGLAIYLNSTLVDAFFRLFNGHTQVNATDLRKLNYPTTEQLIYLGIQAGIQVENNFPSQEKIDHLVETELFKDIKRY